MKKLSFLFVIIISVLGSCAEQEAESTAATEAVGITEAAAEKAKALGLEYAMATQAVLGQNLIKAIQEKGTEGALEFCNIKALPLTDSMATVLDVEIKRVSDFPRNPKNQANSSESVYIDISKDKLKNGENPTPFIHEVGGKTIGYYPIMTNGLCLQCHGKSETEIKPKTLTKIAELYPNDKAKEYEINTLRGIWVVKMPVK